MYSKVPLLFVFSVYLRKSLSYLTSPSCSSNLILLDSFLLVRSIASTSVTTQVASEVPPILLLGMESLSPFPYPSPPSIIVTDVTSLPSTTTVAIALGEVGSHLDPPDNTTSSCPPDKLLS